MKWAVTRIVATILLAFWMLVLVPLHQRGLVPLCPACAGGGSSGVLPACCVAGRKAPATPVRTPAEPPRGCLICSIHATLGTTPSVIPVVSALERQFFGMPLVFLISVDQCKDGDGRCRGPPGC